MRRVLLVLLVLTVLPAAADARPSFSRALRCGPAGAAHVSGELHATVRPYLRAHKRRARAYATLRGNADLTIETSAGASCGLEPTAVAAWNLPPVRFLVGAVPVVVVPHMTLYVSAEARAAQPITTRLHGSMRATAGLSYDGRVRRIGRFSQHFAADPPAGHAQGAVAARITPSVELLLYGQAGPRFDFGTGLEFESGPPRRLVAPVELSAGLSLPGLHVGPYRVLARTFPLANFAADRARIDWDTSADVDLHVWDASGRHTWFRESGIPGLLLSRDDTDGFGPETVEADGGDLTYGACDFDDHGAGRTMVTFSGGSAVVLTHEGDGALFPGGSYRPPVGWCQSRH